MNLLNNAAVNLPLPHNEPIQSYAPGSVERLKLKAALEELAGQRTDIPLLIGGREVRTGRLAQQRVPHAHQQILADVHQAGPQEIELAIQSALDARQRWQALRWEERLAIFLKAAELLAGKYRYRINAACMLATSKNVFQAEIDAACELIDFLRFNCYYAQQIYRDQPPISPTGIWNYLQHRPLEGFVLAIAPFNFTAIAGNLAAAPAIMGNTVLLKPASTSVLPPYLLMQVFREAGLPDGVINFIPGSGGQIASGCLSHPQLAGVHFTGSTAVFQSIWQTIGRNIANYRSYPRIVGETGGKDFIFAHPSADLHQLATAIIRGAFEYQGQKCSAASRAYIPESLWDALRQTLTEEIGRIKVGPCDKFGNFVNAVIDRTAFEKIRAYLDAADSSPDAEIIVGGSCDDRVGFFIEPTVILAKTPDYISLREEIFGPVISIYVYPDHEYAATLDLCDQTSPYALTGAIFARDRQAISLALERLENAAGNFYINDKPTGAVVGQQPFGGSRASGTNDKAGSYLNLLRWVSPRTVKESFASPECFDYPFMDED